MMLDALVLGLDARTKVARLSHTTISEDELFELLVSEFGLEHRGGGKLERLRVIQGFLDEWTAGGRNSVLVVDEAQNLSLPVLEEIRLLSNLRSQGQCSLQIVLAGQPEFRAKLDQENLRQLKQRIGIRYHLTPLSAGETGEYIAHRLSVAGANGPAIFDKGAVAAIFAYASGVPRMINIVCDRALVAGYGANRRRVGRALIMETAEDIEGAGMGAFRAGASGDAAPVPATDVADAPRPRPTPAAAPEAMPAARVAPKSADVGLAPDAPRTQNPSRPLPVRAGVGVIGASVKSTVMRGWVLPTLLVVVAVAAVALSAIGTGWWRTLVGSSAGGPRVASVADGEEPVDAGDSGVGEDCGVSRGRVGIFAPSDIVETSVEEASAGETGGGAEEAATQSAEAPAPVAVEPEFVNSGQERSAASGPGGPYRAIALSSRNANSASTEASQLAEWGFSAEVIPVDIGDGGLWYRVAVSGGYPALDSAREVVDELRRFGYDSAWVHRE
ncbi:MAG: AAA family ATPase [Candidatus Eisenbacteria sp.]|nr:AAA family ATPase [Candidatus Eisenbacteria bacterium]